MTIKNNSVSNQPGKESLANELMQMYRNRAGLTQKEFAQLLNFVSIRTLQQWESGYGLPRPKSLKKLIEAYLIHTIFSTGQELNEAQQLWLAVRTAFKDRTDDFAPYPTFDRSWFEDLLTRANTSVEYVTPLGTHSKVLEFVEEVAQQEKASPPPPNSILHDDSPSQPVVSLPPNNLPVPLTSFVGRIQEIQEMRRLLRTTHLLTLVGIGGVGKTRLALKIAHEELATSNKETQTWQDGVRLVALSSVAEDDSQVLASVILQTLGGREEKGYSSITSLLNFLQFRQTLIILDTCEHIIQSCAELVVTLLENCPGLKILATSREILRVGGEVVYTLNPLNLPSPTPVALSPDELTGYEAFQLFAQRAVDFEVTNENAVTVMEICRKLEGLPLAIELAAARTGLLSVTQIVERLESRFKLLTLGNRASSPRQKTLHNTIDWSYELLSQSERVLLQRLSVFVKSWSVEEAETVCADDGLQHDLILDLLQHLTNKSLIKTSRLQANEYSEVRFIMLDTVREYTQEKLDASQERSVFEKKHTLYFLSLAEQGEAGLRGRNQLYWLGRLEVERDNFHKALVWCNQEGDALTGARLAGALWWFWFTRNYMSDGQQWLETSRRQLSPEMSFSVRIKVLCGAGAMSFLQGNYTQAISLHEEALRLSREANDHWQVSFNLGSLSIQHGYMGNIALAIELAEQALLIARQSGDVWLIIDELTILAGMVGYHGQIKQATELYEEALNLCREHYNQQFLGQTLHYLGVLKIRDGHYEQAEPYLKESLEVWRKIEDKRLLVEALNYLGEVTGQARRYPEAEAFLLESLKVSRETSNQHSIAASLHALGKLASERGQHSSARHYLTQSLLWFHKIGDKKGVVSNLERLAHLDFEQNQLLSATRLYGATKMLWEMVGTYRFPARQLEFDQRLNVLQATLNPDNFKSALAEGYKMHLDEIVAHILEISDSAYSTVTMVDVA